MENYLGNWVNQKEHCKPSHQKLTETIVKITSRRNKKKTQKKNYILALIYSSWFFFFVEGH